MVICPNCHNSEITGALFCSRCGNPLSDIPPTPSQAVPSDSSNQEYSNLDQQKPSAGVYLSLMLLDTGQILPLSGRTEYTVGRSSDGQSILPDIDLENFLAYEKGVSRMHVLIKISGNRVSVTDLRSVNGTRLNGKKIQPNQPQTLNHGDILILGKMKIQVLIRT